MAKRIVLFSTKGGVGKTLIALNLAVSLASDSKKKVCLMDFDTKGFGSISKLFNNITPQRSFVDLIAFLKERPEDFKKEHFVTTSSFGVDFISAVMKPQQLPFLKTEYINKVFSLLDNDYDYIIVDAGNNFNNILVNLFNEANLILLVVTPDVLSVYQIKWAIETLQFLHVPLKMIRLLLNRSESASSISWQEVQVSLGVDIVAQVPSEGKIVGYSVNRGVPVVVDNPKSRFSKAIKQLGQQLIEEEGLYVERQKPGASIIKEELLDKTEDFWKEQGLAEAPGQVAVPKKLDQLNTLKRRIHNRLIEELNLKRLDANVFNDPKRAKELRNKAEILIGNLITEESGQVLSVELQKTLVREILDEALGLGPLEELIADETITDIMVNNRNEIYIERHGKIVLTEKKFTTNEQVKTVIERIIAPLGRRIDESVPMVDARLPDGSRVNAIIPPLALTGPALTIRKFRKERYKVEELIGIKTLSDNMSEFIKACVLCRKNVIVSGGTGSGKTTILNVLSAFIPSNERIITIEDAAELRLSQTHWIRLESRPPNIEGKGSVTIRDLFRNTLRMRPDRIIVGECRGIEALDMLQAMNTGHDGSMTTIHANSTYDVLTRLDSMILMSGVELPIRAIREMIASAIDLIVHTTRLSDGSRKIVQVTELVGMKDELHVDLKDIFVFRQTGVDANANVIGDFHATGYVPSFLQDIKVRGIPISEDLFKNTA